MLDAISRAWHAAEHNHDIQENAVETAARDMARCVGILFRLILQGILAYILKKGAVASSRAVASTGQSVLAKGAQATANETVAEVSALLRKSKLPNEFARLIPAYGPTPDSLKALNPGLDPKKMHKGDKIKYRKASMVKRIKRWRDFTTTNIAVRYNGNGEGGKGDPKYSKKLDCVKHLFTQLKR